MEEWLPGLVRGNGNDGRRITLRQLLQHTSGLYDYLDDDALRAKYTGTAFFAHRYDGATPEELVRTGLAGGPVRRRCGPGSDGEVPGSVNGDWGDDAREQATIEAEFCG